MNITVKGKKEQEFPNGTTVEDVIESLGFHKDSVIVLLDDTPIPIDQELEDGAEIKVIPVVSGG